MDKITDKVAVIGFIGSGKTAYAVAMYNIMRFGVGSFSLRENNDGQDSYLGQLWKDLLKGQWPLPSDDKSVYNFELLHHFKHVINFDWLDYPGGVVLEHSHDLAPDFKQQLAEASCLLVLINGESFVFDGDPRDQQLIQAESLAEYKQTVRNNLIQNNDLAAILALSSMGDIALPPTAIIVTKFDLIHNYQPQWKGSVSEIVKSNFASIFGGEGCPDERIVMLSPVTMGKNIARGKVSPEGVEYPIAFAVLSILRRRILLQNMLKNEKQGKLTEKDKGLFKKFFNAMEISRLKNGILEDEEAIRKMAKDAHYLLDLFPLEKPLYVNNTETDLRTFFTGELGC